MARWLPVVVVALCAVAVFAAPQRMKALAPDGKPSAVPTHWQEIDSAVDYTRTVNLTVHLQRRNMDVLKAEVDARSDPQNKKYGQWYTQEEIAALTNPTDATVKQVLHWLETLGVKSVQVETATNAAIFCPELPLAVAEKVLDLNFRVYQEKSTGKTLTRATGLVRIPESMEGLVQTIVGASGFPVLHGHVKSDAPQAVAVTPPVIVTRYNVSIDAPVAPGNLKAVAEFQGQYIRDTDVCTFYTTYSMKGDCKLNQIIGFNTPLFPGVESTLDVEYIAATASDSPLDFYIFGGMDFCSDMTEWTTKLLALSNAGYVHSVSYGAQDYTPICDDTVRSKIDQDFMTLSGRGISIIIASGDMGSGEYSRAGYNNGFLVPSWPAESPYATAVGATYFYMGDLNTESAVTQFGSGGGFSWNEKTQPTWQTAAVANYFSVAASKLPPAKAYNPTGRGTPDVSALGEEYTVFIKGQPMPGIGGTSASTPVFAGMVTRLNSIRLLANKGTLGLLNPLLYQNPTAFYDVTIGSNKVSPNTVGWECAAGWDPVTGLGTPNYKALEAVVQALP